jgi:DNA-directed RNA polymerase subunit F
MVKNYKNIMNKFNLENHIRNNLSYNKSEKLLGELSEESLNDLVYVVNKIIDDKVQETILDMQPRTEEILY